MHDKMCLYPFTHLFMTQLQTDSEYRLNCCSVNNLDEMHCNGSMIGNYNSEYFRELRKEHYEGRGLEHPHCKVCKEAEDRTGTSARISNNKHFAKQFDVDFETTIENIRLRDFNVLVNDILSMEYMPSNYCNYACIMCSAFASTQRYQIDKIYGTPEYKFGDYDPPELDEILDNVQLLSFAGGETLLQPKVIKMIDEMIANGKTGKKISILTNVSKYNRDLYEKLEKFDKCFMTFSIDGIGRVIEYQRRFSKWENVADNFLKIRANHPKIEYVINYVVTAVSAAGIPDFLRWAHDNDVQDIIFSPVKVYDFMSIDALPTNVIDRLRSEVDSIAKLPYKGNINDFQQAVERAISLYDTHSHNVAFEQAFLNRMRQEDSTRRDGLTLAGIIPDWNINNG